MFLGSVVVDGNVLPAVAEVAFVAEEADKAAIDKEPESLRRQIVVLVDFWLAIVELIY